MRQSKLVDLLRTFSTRQLTRLEEYLASPYFNKNEDLLGFFRLLKPFAPGFSSDELDKAVFLRKQKMDTRKLAYWMSDLLKLVEGFLTAETLLGDPQVTSRALLENYFEKELPKHYKAVLDKAERELREFPFRDTGYFSGPSSCGNSNTGTATRPSAHSTPICRKRPMRSTHSTCWKNCACRVPWST